MTTPWKIQRQQIKIDGFFDRIRIRMDGKKKILVFGCPVHPNTGDIAQTECLERWINNNYEDRSVYYFNHITSEDCHIDSIANLIGKEDLIFLHSGYIFTDNHLEIRRYIKVIKTFLCHQIVIFPQTIYLKNDKLRNDLSLAINSHPKITLLARDETSYHHATELFPNANLHLYPDIVTTLIGTLNYDSKRNGIFLCMRDDTEKHYTGDQIENLRMKLEKTGYQVDMGDTNICCDYRTIVRKRRFIIDNMIRKISKYKVVITDRYHGTIFTLVAGSKVVVVDSNDHKLRSGVKWFPDSYSNRISFASDMESAYQKAVEMINAPEGDKLDPYFELNYYQKLKNLLD